MSTEQNEAGAYEPRPGERVTVRRYIAPTTGERSLCAEHVGIVTETAPGDSTGYYLRLDTCPDRIFTGYQFLGAGTDGSGPSSLVTEVMPVKATFSRQISPELVVGTDSSQCIVLLVGGTGPKDPIRKVTVSDVDAFKAALDDARTAQHIALEEADTQRVPGIDEKRRAEGKLTKGEAVDWLTGKGYGRGHAVRVADRLCREGGSVLGMTYEGGYWVVPRRLTQAEAVEWLTGKDGDGMSRSSALTLLAGVQRGRAVSVKLAGMTYEDGYWVVPA